MNTKSWIQKTITQFIVLLIFWTLFVFSIGFYVGHSTGYVNAMDEVLVELQSWD